VIHRRGPWRNIEAVEFATLEWVDWFNHRASSNPLATYRQRKLRQTSTRHWNNRTWPPRARRDLSDSLQAL
jgi:hypothetical protein